MNRVCLCSILHSAPVKNFSGSSYVFYWSDGNPYDWEISKTICNKQSGYNLVSIESREEWKFLHQIISNENTAEYFIGLRKDPTGVWRWLSDNSTVNASSKGDWPWATGEPSDDSFKENCAQMYGNYEDKYGFYNDVSCTWPLKTAGYICEFRGEGGNRPLIHITRNWKKE